VSLGPDEGGDPPCWAHLFEAADGAGATCPDDLLVQLANRAADAIVIADPDGRIVFWNDAATRVLGFTHGQAVGASLDLFIPERHQARHWEGYARVMATGVTQYGERLLQVPAVHADGSRRSIAFTVTLLHDGAGGVVAIAAVIRDETDRRAEEQALRTRVRELEGHDA